MKKFIVGLLAIVLFAVPAFGAIIQSLDDSVLEAALQEIAGNGGQWAFVSAIPSSYANGTTAHPTGVRLAYATVTPDTGAIEADGCATGTSDYNQDDGVNANASLTGLGVNLCADNIGTITVETGLTAVSADAMCVYDTVNSVVLGCTNITTTSITSGDTVTYDGNAWFVFNDIIAEP